MNRHTIQSAVRIAGLVFVGLFAGFLTGILVLELSLRQFSSAVYAQLQQVALVGLPLLASVLLFPALITTVALVVMEFKTKDRGFWLVAGALALLLAALITTLVVNVPINVAEGGWNVMNPPADWADIRDRWQLGHAVRTFAAVAAFGALSVAAVQQPIRRRSLQGAPV